VIADAVAKSKHKIMKNLNATSDAELVQYAIRNHIIAG